MCATVLVLAIAGSSSSVAGSGTAAPSPASSPVPTLPSNPTTATDPDAQVASTEAARLVQLVQVAPTWTPVATAPSPLLSSPPAAPATQNLVDSALIWTTVGNWEEVLAWVQSHRPVGSTSITGTGSLSRYGVVEESGVGFAYPVSSGAIQSEQVSVGVVPLADGQVGVRADAQVIWYPTRPRAEAIPPGERAVAVEVSGGTSVDSPPAVIASRTLTDPGVVSGLASKIRRTATPDSGHQELPRRVRVFTPPHPCL